MVSIYLPARNTDETVIAHYSKSESITKEHAEIKQKWRNQSWRIKHSWHSKTQLPQNYPAQKDHYKLTFQSVFSGSKSFPVQKKTKERVVKKQGEGNFIEECWFHSVEMNLFDDVTTTADENKVFHCVLFRLQRLLPGFCGFLFVCFVILKTPIQCQSHVAILFHMFKTK